MHLSFTRVLLWQVDRRTLLLGLVCTIVLLELLYTVLSYPQGFIAESIPRPSPQRYRLPAAPAPQTPSPGLPSRLGVHVQL